MKLTLLFSLALVLSAPAAEFIERQIDDDPRLRYRIIGPKKLIPEGGYRLVVFLPGGDGSGAFTGWCNALYLQAIPDDFVAVQLIAPVWTEGGHDTVWPTRLTPVEDMAMPVEEFFEKAVAAVGEEHTIREGEIYTFSWSSGGVPAYLIAAEKRAGVRGHFIAMAVFRERWVPDDLRKVKGQRFFLYQSPDDGVTPLESAEEAKETLAKNGADVWLKTYPGGHGWTQGAAHFADVREGFGTLVSAE